MPKTALFFVGMLIGMLMIGLIVIQLSPGMIMYTYDGRPYIKHGGCYYMLISDEPMKINLRRADEDKECERSGASKHARKP